ncbi:MAG: hypothetical protein QXS68_05350 [Candidatus Methanomethylicaceae archaeon]
MEWLQIIRMALATLDRDKRLQTAYEAAFRYERDYRGCVQALVESLHEDLRMNEPEIFRAASSLS